MVNAIYGDDSKSDLNLDLNLIDNFYIYDGSLDYIPMRQITENYSAFYSIFNDLYFDSFSFNDNAFHDSLVLLPNILVTYLFFTPFTHEEAHRSILTNKGIASISQPICNDKGAAYVKGVSDSTLQNLRDTDFASFLRLHTAGIESDYFLMQKDFENLVFSKSDTRDFKNWVRNSGIDYMSRLISVFSYEFILADMYNPPKNKLLEEEENEFERDIVGHDVYGFIHHIFNPTAEYGRYWDPCDFSSEEIKFGKRVGFLSLLNLPIISPMLFNKFYFSINENHIISFNTGYALAPFGDFIDENIYYGYFGAENPIRLSFYARQYGNKNNWFPAFGLKLLQYSPVDWLSVTAAGHIWSQPKNLSFTESKGELGGAFEMEVMFFPKQNKNALGDLGFFLGFLTKSKGFMPEIESHDFHWRISTGLSLRK